MRIGIFGGAFDPVHNGHVQIADSFLASNIIDKLLVLPTPASPHKETSDQISFSHRYDMLKLAFQNNNHIVVSDLETKLPRPSYTLRTIEHLQEKNPESIYYLCIGEDSLTSFHEWWKYDDILIRVPLVVASRPDADSSGLSQSILNRTLFVDHSEVNISSTQIRNIAREGDSRLKDLVPDSVAQYIIRYNLCTE